MTSSAQTIMLHVLRVRFTNTQPLRHKSYGARVLIVHADYYTC